MKTLVGVATVVLAVILSVGCGGGASTMQSTATGTVPDWYSNPPQDPTHLYAVSTAASQDMQLAIDKALTGARAEIARQVETKMNSLQKRFDEETGIGQDAQLLQQYTQATKAIVSTSLTGSKMAKQEHLKDGNMWRAYVLADYPIGEANKALLESIKKSQEMYTRFRASQAYQELDSEVQKIEDAKKK
jgi:hypothetical protein